VGRRRGNRLVREIVAMVADDYDLKPSNVRGRDLRHRVAQARHEAIKLIHEFTDLSLVDIGKEFDGRDHTTILYAIEKSLDWESEAALDGYRATLIERFDAEPQLMFRSTRAPKSEFRHVL
jgi:hypothetical protein